MPNFKCPECGIDLEGISPRKHALSHWPEYLPDLPNNKEARKRQATLYEMQEILDKAKPRKGE